MDCSTAQHDMHRRLDANTAGATGDFAELDAHLAGSGTGNWYGTYTIPTGTRPFTALLR